MKTHASILREVPGEFETALVDVDEPRGGEITVKIAASGLCHTDIHLATGDIPCGVLPFAGGHEGAGVVVKVGPGTPEFEVGDHVVLTFIPACGRCRWCAEGKQNLCDLGALTLHGSRFDDPTDFRMSLDGAPVGQMAGISTFSEFTTVSARSAIKVPKDLPLDKICLLGCGVGTGWGSAVNAAEVRPGHTVIVIGVGGIGTSAVQGAANAGATTIIAVDPVAFKRESSLTFGATHTAESIKEAGDLARSLTDGQGADSAIVTVGVTTAEHVSAAVRTIRKAGTVVVTGSGPHVVSDLPINLPELAMTQKRIVGALYGAASPFTSIPWLLGLYRNGALKLDEMITRTYSLDQVSQGYRDMLDGTIVRGVVTFDS